MFSEILIKIIQLSTRIESCICYSVSLGYAVILVCSTMPDRTCEERITGAPIGYGYWNSNDQIPKPLIRSLSDAADVPLFTTFPSISFVSSDTLLFSAFAVPTILLPPEVANKQWSFPKSHNFQGKCL